MIRPANYDQHLDLLRECDVVIEAISERMDWKSDLYRKVAPAPRRALHLRQQHVGTLDQRTCAGVSGKSATSVLRRALLQSAALHAPRGTHCV
jgi:hypothetical protein